MPTLPNAHANSSGRLFLACCGAVAEVPSRVLPHRRQVCSGRRAGGRWIRTPGPAHGSKGHFGPGCKFKILSRSTPEAPPVSPGLRLRMSRVIFLSRLCCASSRSIGGSTLCWRFATVQPIRVLAKEDGQRDAHPFVFYRLGVDWSSPENRVHHEASDLELELDLGGLDLPLACF